MQLFVSRIIHSLVTLPRIVPAAFCMLELVDVTCHFCLKHVWIELSAVGLIRVNFRRHTRNTPRPGNLELMALDAFYIVQYWHLLAPLSGTATATP